MKQLAASKLSFIALLHYQVEFQDQSQLMLKPSEMHRLDQELPKRVRARLVSDCEQRLVQSPARGLISKRSSRSNGDKSSGCPSGSLQPTRDTRPAQSLEMWEFRVLINIFHVVDDKLECKDTKQKHNDDGS